MGSTAKHVNEAQPAGLYVHIPFCREKCPYCDFCSITDLSLRSDFVQALLMEIDLTADRLAFFDTVYIGGGTPSVLPTASLQQILSTVQSRANLSPEPEITVEINPGTVTAEQLSAYRQMGVNRLNIGAQSFQEENLAFLGRIHSVQQVFDTVTWARRAGFDNLGLDLIYGLPNQSLPGWQEDLQQAVDQGVEHLSCYTLTFETGTPMERDMRQGRLQPPAENLVAEMMTLTVERLAAAGYQRYEVSNFARGAACRSRHNQKYWTSAPYLGLGPSAHSWMAPERYWNKKDVAVYIDDLNAGRLPIEGRERLDRKQMITEAVFLGLRTTDGIDGQTFSDRFGVSLEQLFGETIERLTSEGMLTVADERIALSDTGMLLGDAIAAEFIEQL